VVTAESVTTHQKPSLLNAVRFILEIGDHYPGHIQSINLRGLLMRSKKIKIFVIVVVLLGLVTFGLVINRNSSTNGPSSSANSTITFAEGPGASPNWIFPYQSCTYFSVSNINAFMNEMYRPVYWFGLGSTATVVPSLSVASMPVMSNGNKTVTFQMKGWKFADGQTMDAKSVMFFLNMYKADPTGYCGYNAGYGIPDQVSNATGSGSTVTINFKTSVNPNWILYNYLSELYPMSNSWDITGPGKPSTCATGVYGAATTDVACKAVLKYMTAQSAITSTYTSALWQNAVDGPWKLTAFDNLGNLTLVPNPTYSGPQKAQVKFVKELAFTSATAEEDALRAGTISLGYVDNTMLTSKGTPTNPGANWPAIAANYNLKVGAPWSVDYAAYNFNTKNPQAVFLDQLYIRQAMQMTVDQPGMIDKIYKGYGYMQINPLPPVTPAAISGGASTKNPYPFNPTKAAALLKSHGWVNTNGSAVCQQPGTGPTQCGAGITKGENISITFEYGSGVPSLALEVNTEVAQWKVLGINTKAVPLPFNSVVSDCVGNSANWSICLWGAGWIYAPDFYPSGEALYVPGASFNIGNYSNAALTAAVKASTFGTASLKDFADIAAVQLPDLYQPNATNSFSGSGIGEVIKTLKSKIGFTPNSLVNFMPEYYYY
jgi:peptide/nickel transport system substrate-binding protein